MLPSEASATPKPIVTQPTISTPTNQQLKSETKHSWAELHKFLDNLANLVDVKTIVTFAVVGCLCYLATIQNVKVPSELFAAVISSIMTYFFTKKVDEKTTKKE